MWIYQKILRFNVPMTHYNTCTSRLSRFDEASRFSGNKLETLTLASTKFSRFFSLESMAAKPLTSEAIALTEKKMDMTLDDIIKMSKNTTATKPKQQHRVLNKGQKTFGNAVQEKAFKVRQYMGSRSSVRQGVLAQRRSNFQGNHFPLTTEVARKATSAPARNRAFNGSMVPNKMNRARGGALPVQRRSNGGFAKLQQQRPHQQQQDNAVTKQRPQTLDSLFANMKEQRMKVVSRQNNNNNNGGGGVQRNNNNGGGGVQRNGGIQRNGGGRARLPWVRG
ncbi:hypothetical protein LWI29_011168 [Acer saccharum]|uniref:Uncharacterized protein n=1 Tax=Acer saccharum TaxID=4024 RepID=A0AA39S6T6_ACESA|nr:hypothetical protein LWI29_011168 [Acer saccharum]